MVSPTGGPRTDEDSEEHERLPRFLDRIEDKFEDAFQDLAGWFKHRDKDDQPRAGVPQGPVYVGLPSTDVTITGVQLPPFGAASMAFTVAESITRRRAQPIVGRWAATDRAAGAR